MHDLITSAVSRAGIGRQVTAHQVLEIAQQRMDVMLTEKRKGDAWAHAFAKDHLVICVLNSSARQYLYMREFILHQEILEALPTIKIKKIIFRIARKERL